jgi:hypothetical protein
LCRHDYRNVPVLAANEHRLALRGIEERGKALFGIGGGYGFHMSILDEIDKTDNSQMNGAYSPIHLPINGLRTFSLWIKCSGRNISSDHRPYAALAANGFR